MGHLRSCSKAALAAMSPLLLALWPMQAWACSAVDDGSPLPLPGVVRFLALLIVELIILLPIGAGWLIARKGWPNGTSRWKDIWFYLFLCAALALSAGLGAFGSFVISAFEQVFASFGADLPIGTAVLFGGRHLLWLMLVATMALRLRVANTKAITPFALVCVADLVIFAFVLWALYAPIFTLC